MRKPFFSVILPIYNSISFLKKNLKSIFNQTFKDFEIIVIDNYSNDGSYEYIKKIKKKNLVYARIDNRGIIAKSRNLGIKISKGKWLAFIDSDDIWLNTKLEVFYNKLKKYEQSDIISSLFNIIENNKIIYIHKFKYKDNFYENLLLKGNCFSTSSTIVKKKFLNNHRILFNEKKNLVTVEDYDLWLNIVKQGGKISLIKQVLTSHTKRADSMSNSLQHFINYLSIIKMHIFDKENNFKIKYLIYFILFLRNSLRIIKFLIKNKVIVFIFYIFKKT